ncbi:MAG: hypothetical protein ACI9FD_003479 [Gammaproteobacteria bacterium]|jgi:hypothetical protein
MFSVGTSSSSIIRITNDSATTAMCREEPIPHAVGNGRFFDQSGR